MKTKNDFLKALEILAQRCGYELQPVEVALYVKHLEPLGWDALLPAMERLYVNLKGGARHLMPSINDVREAAGSAPMTDRSQGTEIASRCLAAVAKYGSMRMNGEFRARPFVGELGWLVIDRMFGGWVQFCDLCTSENYGTMHAQIRDESVGMCERARKGLLFEAPRAEQLEGVRPDVARLVAALPAMKTLEEK